MILVEYTKQHKTKEASRLSPCNYTIKQLIELLCFYIVDKRLFNSGYILLKDIHPFWLYKRPESSTLLIIDVQVRLMILNLAVVRGKGHLRGAKRKKAYKHRVISIMNSFKMSYFTVVIYMWVIPHQETEVACSCNWPLSPHGRPSVVLLESCISELAGVSTSSINPLPFLLRHSATLSSLPPPSVNSRIRTGFSAFASIGACNSCCS